MSAQHQTQNCRTDFYLAKRIHKKIVRLDVTMNNRPRVQVLQAAAGLHLSALLAVQADLQTDG